MKVLIRIIVFLLLVGALNFVGLLATGFFFGMSASFGNVDPVASKQAAKAGSEGFLFQYWPAIAAGITLLSALVAFGARLLTFLIGGSLAVVSFFFLRLGIASYRAKQNPPAAAVTSSTPRSVDRAAEQRAMKLFPDLGVADSRLNQEFLRRYNEYQKDNPQYFADPEWPTKLAREAHEGITR